MSMLRCLVLFTWLVSCVVVSQPKMFTIASKYTDCTFEYLIELPLDYQTNDKRYPLLLILDGQNYGELVSRNAQFLAQSDDIPEHIIVSLHVKNRIKHYTPTDSRDWEGDGGAPFF